MHSERGRRRERDHFSVNDPVVNPRSSQAQTLIDPRECSTRSYLNSPSLQEADKVVAADLMEKHTRLVEHDVSRCGICSQRLHLAGSWLQERSSDSVQTWCTKHWTRSGENQGLKTNPSVAGWQARQCWWKCSHWIGRRSVLETLWRLYERGKNVIAEYDRLSSATLSSIWSTWMCHWRIFWMRSAAASA